VISPWSKGGYVSSEVFDHTSLIRFIEARFANGNSGLIESNITPWRRAVSGDLTSAFNFRTPNSKVVALPDTSAYVPPNQNRYPDYVPPVPANQMMPVQEPGTRPARPVPYTLNAEGLVNTGDGSFAITFSNAGKTAVYQVRSGNSSQGPWTYTVGKGEKVADAYPISASGLTGYDLSVYGPNGFLRAFRGSLSGSSTVQLDLRTDYNEKGNIITLHGTNRGSQTIDLGVADAYTGKVTRRELKPGQSYDMTWELHQSFGWYDLVATVESDSTFRYQLAGHVETGEESRTDPAIGAV